MRVLLTGGSGMLGSHLARGLVAADHELRCLLRRPDEAALLDGVRCERVAGDVLDASSLRAACRDIEAVVHTAGLVSYDPRRAEALQRVNHLGTRTVLDAAADSGVRRVLLTSSIATLGHVPGDGVGDEDTAYNWPEKGFAYFASKRAAERAVLEEQRLEGLAVNPGVTLGERDLNLHAGRMIAQVARGGPPGFPPGATTLAAVEDVVAGHLAALERGQAGRRYILGGHPMSFADAYALIARVLQKPAPGRPLGALPLRMFGRWRSFVAHLTGNEPDFTPELARIVVRNRRYGSSRAEQELGYTRSPLEPCIQRAVAWYRDAGLI